MRTLFLLIFCAALAVASCATAETVCSADSFLEQWNDESVSCIVLGNDIDLSSTDLPDIDRSLEITSSETGPFVLGGPLRSQMLF